MTEGGTRLAYRRSGKGPPLVLIHGTAADHSRWRPVLPALEEHFNVYAIDRRGRGGSGDSAYYAVAREYGDQPLHGRGTTFSGSELGGG